MSSLEQVFAPEGALAAAIPGYRERRDQLSMAQAIRDAIEANSVLVAEAGTGTGKTFAYLVPALLCGGKVIVSTVTKRVQDQLSDCDLPAVRAALTSGATVALLKGRANYVCLYRLRRAVTEKRATTSDEAVELMRIERFAASTVSGDRADLAEVPEDAPIWAQATSTRDNCLGQGCPDYDDCFVMRARRNALAADVVVINHHLFFADVVLRDEGVAELLPACNTVIFDEAHQLPETARLFFGESLTTSQLIELSRDARAELRSAGGGSPELEALANRLERAMRDLRLALGVPEAGTRRWESPFRFGEQALIYLPPGLPPDPNDPAFTDAVLEAAYPVLEASGGRAFLLFTTLRALRRAHDLLRGRLPYPLLVQGTGSRSDLLTRFRSLGNAVLLGSASFWEGVDVRGEALSLVVIDKLPFAPPDDPVLAARIDALKAAGRNPFNELQLPQAVLQLKQGAGRLIRDEGDRGGLKLCDPRLLSRPYGARVLASLPPMKRTRSLEEVQAFFATLDESRARLRCESG